MSMHFVFFIFSLLIVITLFLISKLGESVGARAAFIALSGIVLMLTGLFVWVEGLTLPIVESFSPEGVITYVTMTAVVGNELWMMVNVLFWLGAVVILSALVTAAQETEQKKDDVTWDV